MTRIEPERLAARYARIAAQLAELYRGYDDALARMASAAALLHHKMPHFFWTGFYRHEAGRLIVGPYQGPLACAELRGPDGVCWACLQRGTPLLVPDVDAFPGHVACDARSRSEVVVPVRDRDGAVRAVLDVDAEHPAAFTAVDRDGLTMVADLIWRPAAPARTFTEAPGTRRGGADSRAEE